MAKDIKKMELNKKAEEILTPDEKKSFFQELAKIKRKIPGADLLIALAAFLLVERGAMADEPANTDKYAKAAAVLKETMPNLDELISDLSTFEPGGEKEAGKPVKPANNLEAKQDKSK